MQIHNDCYVTVCGGKRTLFSFLKTEASHSWYAQLKNPNKPLADLGVGVRPSLGVQILSISCSFWKIWVEFLLREPPVLS